MSENSVIAARLKVDTMQAALLTARKNDRDLFERRKALIGKASDPEISRLLAENRQAITDNKITIEDLEIGVDLAKKRLAEAHQHDAEARAEALHAEAKRHADEMLKESQAIDASCESLMGSWTRREESRRKLLKTNCLNPSLSSRLGGGARLARALAHVGLRDILRLEVIRGGSANYESLTEADTKVLSMIARPNCSAADDPERNRSPAT